MVIACLKQRGAQPGYVVQGEPHGGEFHVFLAPAGLPLAVVVAAPALFLGWIHRRAYRPLFAASVVPSASLGTAEDVRVRRRA